MPIYGNMDSNIIVMSIFLASLMVAYLPGSSGIAVMSIDMGSEWLKIGIVKPGVPMEIALNKESRRKTPFVVSMKGDERLFSDPAMSVSIKQPPKAFIYLSHLLGKKFDSPAVELYKKRFPYYKLIKDEERGTVLFQGEENQVYSVEELVAMVLNNSKHIAENFANHKMKDIVLTVPVFFNQAERSALIFAANITGLKVLQLINDNTAVALNYGIFRAATFNGTVKHIMFYDMGASHTTVTIAGYSTTKVKHHGYAETLPMVAIKGVGFDTKLGGLEMDIRLRDHLVKGFKEKYSKLKSDITHNHRAMAKLLKEARRVRQVLSANTEHYAQIEGLFEEKDFRMKITRVEFEEMCSDLFNLVIKAVKMAFDAASMSKDDIENVILMGGSTRMPRVQEKLMTFFGRTELGKSINTDEAAALGAVYKAAGLMAGFKVKEFIVKELNMYPVDVQFERSSNAGESPRHINRNLYHRLNIVPQKKIMTFNRKLTDFNFNISYGDLTFFSEEIKNSLAIGGDPRFAHVKLSGVDTAHQKNAKGTPKGVKAFFQMDESGILYIDKVEAHFEKTPKVIEEEESTLSKIGSKLSSLFGSLKKEEPDEKVTDEPADKSGNDKGKSSDSQLPTKEENVTSDKVNSSKSANDTTTGNSTSSKNANVTEKVKNVVIVEEISFSIEKVDIPTISLDKLQASITKLNLLEAHDQAKNAIEKARNALEAFITDYKDKLEQEEVQKLSTADERTKIEKALTDEYNWFDEEAYDANEETLKKKLKSLLEVLKELQFRLDESKERPKAISAMLQSLNLSNIFYETMMTIPDAKEIYSDKDYKDLGKIFTETTGWFMTTWKKQNETDLAKNPVLLTKDIIYHQGKLDREIMYLISKAKYYVPKPKPKNETTSNTTKSKKEKPEAEPLPSNTTTKNETKVSNSTEESSAGEKEKVSTEQAKEKPTSTEESKEKPTSTEEVKEKPTLTEEAKEKSTLTEEASNEKPTMSTEKVSKKVTSTEQSSEKSILTEENTKSSKENKTDAHKPEDEL